MWSHLCYDMIPGCMRTLTAVCTGSRLRLIIALHESVNLGSVVAALRDGANAMCKLDNQPAEIDNMSLRCRQELPQYLSQHTLPREHTAGQAQYASQVGHGVVFSRQGRTTTKIAQNHSSTSGNTSAELWRQRHCFPPEEPAVQPMAEARHAQLTSVPTTSAYGDDEGGRGLAIVGCARSLGVGGAGVALRQMAAIGHAFAWSHLIVYENDSSDSTLSELRTYGGSNVTILSEVGVPGGRIQRLAHCRDTLLRAALALGSDYVLMYDLDLKMGPSAEGVNACLGLSEPWAVCCANHAGPYYDLLPLRTIRGGPLGDWMPGDYNECKHRCGRGCVKGTPWGGFTIGTSDAPIEVASCFGGSALYRSAALHGCTYGNLSTHGHGGGCEHTRLHDCMRRKHGARFFIQPRMLVRRSGLGLHVQ